MQSTLYMKQRNFGNIGDSSGSTTGADPGLPAEGGANPPWERAKIQISPKHCMKLRKFWSGGVPLHPPLHKSDGWGAKKKKL